MDNFQSTLEFAKQCDLNDPFKSFKDKFDRPHSINTNSDKVYYFTGHSLGLRPKTAKNYVLEEVDRWGDLAVYGHFRGDPKWMEYDQSLSRIMSKLLGAKEHEVAMMNALTVNIHLLLASFYRPLGKRKKILMEATAFPSDFYAVKSFMRLFNIGPENLIELKNHGQEVSHLSTQYILETIEKHKDELTLIFLGNSNYLTGQSFDLKTIGKKAKELEIPFGVDLAHGAGNLELNLHEDQIDFAGFCTYKYLNSGPGALGGIYIHEDHLDIQKSLYVQNRLEGWWGNSLKTRFKMEKNFDSALTARSWQISNNPILTMATTRASLEIFDQTSMREIRKTSDHLTGYLEYLLHKNLEGHFKQITTSNKSERGAMLTLEFSHKNGSDFIQEKLQEKNFIVDFRHPNIIRIAPVVLYNTYEEVYRLVETLVEITN